MKNILNFIVLMLIFVIVFKVFVFLLPAIIIALAILVLLNGKLIKQILELFAKRHEYKSMPGQTYKVCGNCQRKADRRASACVFCGSAFE